MAAVRSSSDRTDWGRKSGSTESRVCPFRGGRSWGSRSCHKDVTWSTASGWGHCADLGWRGEGGAGRGGHPATVPWPNENPGQWEARLIFQNEVPEGPGGGDWSTPAGRDSTALLPPDKVAGVGGLWHGGRLLISGSHRWHTLGAGSEQGGSCLGVLNYTPGSWDRLQRIVAWGGLEGRRRTPGESGAAGPSGDRAGG